MYVQPRERIAARFSEYDGPEIQIVTEVHLLKEVT